MKMATHTPTPLPLLLLLLLVVLASCLLGATRAATFTDTTEYQNCQANPSSTCTELHMNSDGVTGTIPTEIGRLTALGWM